jgi:hypothetical protein
VDLNFRERILAKDRCKKLIAVITYDNSYSQFYRRPCECYTKRLLPLIRQFFLILNIINEFVELIAIFQLLLESVLPEIDYYLRFYTFSRFQ